MRRSRPFIRTPCARLPHRMGSQPLVKEPAGPASAGPFLGKFNIILVHICHIPEGRDARAGIGFAQFPRGLGEILGRAFAILERKGLARRQPPAHEVILGVPWRETEGIAFLVARRGARAHQPDAIVSLQCPNALHHALERLGKMPSSSAKSVSMLSRPACIGGIFGLTPYPWKSRRDQIISTVPTMIAGAAGSSSHAQLSARRPRKVEIGNSPEGPNFSRRSSHRARLSRRRGAHSVA